MSKALAFGHRTRGTTTGEPVVYFAIMDVFLTRRRKGHFIISDYADKMVNKRFPNFPLDYAVSSTFMASDIEALPTFSPSSERVSELPRVHYQRSFRRSSIAWRVPSRKPESTISSWSHTVQRAISIVW